MKKEKVYIIVLNYNNWEDTIECSESVLRSDYADFQLVVVDNQSTDNSMTYIRNWAEGKLNVWTPDANQLKSLITPPLPKPLSYAYYEEQEITQDLSFDGNPLILIQSSCNNGYGAGNNIGIRFAIQQNDYSYIYLLNNDTVIPKNTVSVLLACAQQKNSALGLLGSTLLLYDEPSRLQTYGGRFNRALAVQTHNLAYQPFSQARIQSLSKKEIDYIVGASLLMTRAYIEKAGLLPEEYFIYFEEMDLITRCQRNHLAYDMCPQAIVYHKESATIKKENMTISTFSDFYAMRNRIVFTKKFFPQFLPTVYLGLCYSIYLRLKRREYEKAKNIAKIIFGKRRYGK